MCNVEEMEQKNVIYEMNRNPSDGFAFQVHLSCLVSKVNSCEVKEGRSRG
jgi:hypothetical protein